MKVEKINREVALKYLESNAYNRKIVRANVDFIKNEINSGRFMMNGQPIIFDSNGLLLDGQHRLVAVSETDKEIEVLVVRGIDRDSFKTIDTGRNRKSSDVLSIEGVSYSTTLSSAVNRILHKFHQSRTVSKTGAVKNSNSEILKFYQDNKEELDNYANFTTSLYSSEVKIIPPAVTTAMMFLLSRENKNKARSFIREIYTGKKETDDESALSLRKRLINNKIENVKQSDTILRNLFLSAFRGYCQGKNLSKIQISNNQMFKVD